MEKKYESRDGKHTVKVITEDMKFINGSTALAIYTKKGSGITNTLSVFPAKYGFCTNPLVENELDVIEIKPDLGLYFWAFQYASTKNWVLQGTAYKEKDAEVIRRDHGFINKRKVFKLDV